MRPQRRGNCQGLPVEDKARLHSRRNCQRLKGESAVNLDHVQTMEQSRLRLFVGALGQEKMAEVCRALAIATGAPANR